MTCACPPVADVKNDIDPHQHRFRHAGNANHLMKEMLRSPDEYDSPSLGKVPPVTTTLQNAPPSSSIAHPRPLLTFQAADDLADELRAVVGASNDTTEEMNNVTSPSVAIPHNPGTASDAVDAIKATPDSRDVEQYPPILKVRRAAMRIAATTTTTTHFQDLHDLANPKVKRAEKPKKKPAPRPPPLPSYVVNAKNFEDVVDQVCDS